MSKYIIKNCPAILPMTKLCDNENMKNPPDFCENITDCLLKQIVELCKEEWDLRPDMNIDDNSPKEVLQLLEIEEVDE